jgi:SynChlorMet cassette radical SAM/SPASM protein ScmF
MNETLKDNQSPAENGTPPLNQLYFYLTEGCNLACRHCYLAPKFDPDGKKHPVLPFNLFKTAINEALPLGLSGVKLSGGEPLLHPDILSIIEVLRQENLDLVMETNGILCIPELTKAIAKLDNSFVSVSLDGADAETHDANRGVSGAFEKATAAIRSFADNGIQLQVIMSIMQDNVSQIEAVIELAEKLGAGSVKFNMVQPTGRGETIHNTNHGLKIKELLKIGKKIETDLCPQTTLQLFYNYPAAFRSLRHIKFEDGCSVCLEKIWLENQILQEIREGLPEKLGGVCNHCLMKHLCLGSCIAHNYYRANSLWTPFWFCEEAQAAGLFPESRLDFPLNNEPKMI